MVAVEVEIAIHRRDTHDLSIEMRWSEPEGDVDILTSSSASWRDFAALARTVFDRREYGVELAEKLFAGKKMGQQFAVARAAARDKELPLRIRLLIGPTAPELQEIPWETLADPSDGGNPLLMDEMVFFSRFLSGHEWRPISVRAKTKLRVVVLVANPSNLSSWEPGGRPLKPILVKEELERAKSALPSADVTVLASEETLEPLADAPPTLDCLVAAIRKGCDVVYIVCHGFLASDGPKLVLENAGRELVMVPGAELVERLKDIPVPPRLVVLASCQSAGVGDPRRAAEPNDSEPGTDDNGALSALGPRLAEAAIPAVLAMQGNISTATAAKFMPTFLKELQKHGQVDRAMAVARWSAREVHGTVGELDDWWVPVLYTRLRSGRIWYRPGFGATFTRWPSLVEDIKNGKCTPILGPGLTDNLMGTRQEMAWQWAKTYRFPMAPHQREDLPQVAQFLSVSLGPRFPRERLGTHMRNEVLRRRVGPVGHGDQAKAEESPSGTHAEVIDAVVKRVRQSDAWEPHRVLAELPVPYFVTTHPAGLIESALGDTPIPGQPSLMKKPEVEFCRWNTEANWPEPIKYKDPDYCPTLDRPLVVHLFGTLNIVASLVITEDDYFDYLLGVSRKDAVPDLLNTVLVDSSLLFLGFRLDDWDFRVVLRSLLQQAGAARREAYTHVAVQLDPEESRTLAPEQAREYLRKYFESFTAGDSGHRVEINIYWGGVDDFVRELKVHLDDPAP